MENKEIYKTMWKVLFFTISLTFLVVSVCVYVTPKWQIYNAVKESYTEGYKAGERHVVQNCEMFNFKSECYDK